MIERLLSGFEIDGRVRAAARAAEPRLLAFDRAARVPIRAKIIEAFLAPVLEKGFPAAVSVAVPLIGRILSTPDQFVERVYNRHLKEGVQLFSEALGRVFPGMPEVDRLWRLHFMAGTMSHVLSLSQVLPQMTDGVCNLSDRKALVARLVTFLAAGFRAPVQVAETAARN